MKKVFFLILSLSIPQAYASEKYSNKHADIVYASDNELIYKSTDSESSRLWHYDVTNSSGVPINIAKPYLKNSLLSYKKIDDLEIYGTQLSSKEAILISAIQELTTRLEVLENA